MHVIIPVAGFGSRLRPHTYTKPKPLMQVAGNTVLGHILDMLKEIGVECTPNEIASSDVENDDYYGRYFSQTPRMVTNKGSLEIKNSNIDVIQIIQKG